MNSFQFKMTADEKVNRWKFSGLNKYTFGKLELR